MPSLSPTLLMPTGNHPAGYYTSITFIHHECRQYNEIKDEKYTQEYRKIVQACSVSYLLHAILQCGQGMHAACLPALQCILSPAAWLTCS